LFARVYARWRDQFPHAPAILPTRTYNRTLAAFTTAIQADVMSRLAPGTPSIFKAAVALLQEDLGPERWQQQCAQSAARIEAAAVAYRRSDWHCKQYASHSRPPWKPFDQFLRAEMLNEWLHTAKRRGLIDGNGRARDAGTKGRRDEGANLLSPDSCLLSSVREHLADVNPQWLDTLRARIERTDTEQQAGMRAIDAGHTAMRIMERFDDRLRQQIESVIDNRHATQHPGRGMSQHERRANASWRYLLACVLTQARDEGTQGQRDEGVASGGPPDVPSTTRSNT